MPSLADTLAGIILLALNVYVLLGGADFGGGVWDLLASGEGSRRAAHRRVIARAISPVWEANHVWLILAIVLLFTCFPAAFARLSILLHVPLTVMLFGIVLRGSAFVFQSYGGGGGRVFGLSSLITPVLLGMCVGAVASGGLGEGEGKGAGFYLTYIAPWLTPFGFAVGVFALGCFAHLAAVYLTLEAEEPQVQDDFRRRAIASGVAVVIMAAVGLGLFPHTRLITPWLIVLTALAALATFWGLVRRRFAIARATAAFEVSLILWGWAFAQYPYLVPPDLTISAGAAPRVTLELALAAVVAGAVVLFPSLYYLFRVFKSRAGAPPTTPPLRRQ